MGTDAAFWVGGTVLVTLMGTDAAFWVGGTVLVTLMGTDVSDCNLAGSVLFVWQWVGAELYWRFKLKYFYLM
jgi:hypothetical protein